MQEHDREQCERGTANDKGKDGPTMIGEDYLDGLCADYRRRRIEEGPVKAARQWVDRPFEAWLDGLHDSLQPLDDETVAALAAGMSVSLPVRDAMVLSLVAPDGCADKAIMTGFAASPHDPQMQVRMCDELHRAFHDDGRRPDMPTCQRGADMLTDMIARLPQRFAVQPMAMLAYVMWWTGDTRASAFALHCLAVDKDCSLAAIICAAMHRGIMPAWIA